MKAKSYNVISEEKEFKEDPAMTSFSIPITAPYPQLRITPGHLDEIARLEHLDESLLTRVKRGRIR